MRRLLHSRAWSSVIVVVLCVTTLSMAFGTVGHSGADHQTTAAYVQHDASAHRFQGAADAEHSHPLHCLACHVARLLRPRADAASLTAPAVEAGRHASVQSVPVAHLVFAAQPPLRSPPR
jgi:hypothetical protein